MYNHDSQSEEDKYIVKTLKMHNNTPEELKTMLKEAGFMEVTVDTRKEKGWLCACLLYTSLEPVDIRPLQEEFDQKEKADVYKRQVFGSGAGLFFLLACAVSYVFSGYYGLYPSQKIWFDKVRAAFIGRNAE